MEKLSDLKRSIWITRKCRINASERLKEKYQFYQLITVYYSIWVVFFSILNIKDSTTNTISLLVLSSSIALSLFSLYVNSKNFQERYFNLKFNYLKLDELLNELTKVEFEISNNIITDCYDDISRVREKYNTILSTVENHDSIDYFMFLDSPNNNEERKPDYKEKVIIRRHRCKNRLLKLIFYSLPFLFILIFLLYNHTNLL